MNIILWHVVCEFTEIVLNICRKILESVLITQQLWSSGLCLFSFDVRAISTACRYILALCDDVSCTYCLCIRNAALPVIMCLYEATITSSSLWGLRSMCPSFWSSLSVAWHVHRWIQSPLLSQLPRCHDDCGDVDRCHCLVSVWRFKVNYDVWVVTIHGNIFVCLLPVLLSRTWDSRTRTSTRSQASRTRTRTWKLVLEDPRGQGLSSRTTHRVSNKCPGLLQIQSCHSTSHTLVTS